MTAQSRHQLIYMAFDDPKINTPAALAIWLNAVASFLIAFIHFIIRAVLIFQSPHKYVGGYLGLGHVTGLDVFLVAAQPFIWYLPGLFAYRTRGYFSRLYAGVLGIATIIYFIIVPTLQAEVTPGRGGASHLFFYVALSQLVYALFGKCKDEP